MKFLICVHPEKFRNWYFAELGQRFSNLFFQNGIYLSKIDFGFEAWKYHSSEWNFELWIFGRKILWKISKNEFWAILNFENLKFFIFLSKLWNWKTIFWRGLHSSIEWIVKRFTTNYIKLERIIVRFFDFPYDTLMVLFWFWFVFFFPFHSPKVKFYKLSGSVLSWSLELGIVRQSWA